MRQGPRTAPPRPRPPWKSNHANLHISPCDHEVAGANELASRSENTAQTPFLYIDNPIGSYFLRRRKPRVLEVVLASRCPTYRARRWRRGLVVASTRVAAPLKLFELWLSLQARVIPIGSDEWCCLKKWGGPAARLSALRVGLAEADEGQPAQATDASTAATKVKDNANHGAEPHISDAAAAGTQQY